MQLLSGKDINVNTKSCAYLYIYKIMVKLKYTICATKCKLMHAYESDTKIYDRMPHLRARTASWVCIAFICYSHMLTGGHSQHFRISLKRIWQVFSTCPIFFKTTTIMVKQNVKEAQYLKWHFDGHCPCIPNYLLPPGKLEYQFQAIKLP